MNEQTELEQLIKLLMTLSGDITYTADELAEKFSTSTRYIYKCIKTIKDAGFIVREDEKKYSVDKKSPYYKEISGLLHFSEEEAYILTKAIHSIDNINAMKDNLIKKLYSIYDFDRVAETVVRKENSENIHHLIQAIKQKKHVILKDYKSSHSSEIRDRRVEPFDFTTNYISVWCFEPETRSVKLFKTSRIHSVTVLETPWENEKYHNKGYIDIFRITSTEKTTIKLNLTLRAYNLLIEEYPLAEKYITPIEDNHFIFDGWVCNFYGVGRFILGLLDEIEIISPLILKDFLNEKIKSKKF